MTWFGTVSAWAAALVGVLLIAGGALQFSLPIVAVTGVTAGALLLLGAYRTLRKLSGGLRLLAGAWGVAAGLLAMGVRVGAASLAADISGAGADYYAVSPSPAHLALQLGLLAIALLGLALTVLHKETK